MKRKLRYRKWARNYSWEKLEERKRKYRSKKLKVQKKKKRMKKEKKRINFYLKRKEPLPKKLAHKHFYWAEKEKSLKTQLSNLRREAKVIFILEKEMKYRDLCRRNRNYVLKLNSPATEEVI